MKSGCRTPRVDGGHVINEKPAINKAAVRIASRTDAVAIAECQIIVREASFEFVREWLRIIHIELRIFFQLMARDVTYVSSVMCYYLFFCVWVMITCDFSSIL